MVNSTGGVNGRKIVVDSADDGYTGTGNKQATQNAVNTDFALVGGFSTFCLLYTSAPPPPPPPPPR